MLSILRTLSYSVLFYALIPGTTTLAGNCPPSVIHQTAYVDYVHDGDTLKLKDGRKIRLIGINAPELARGNTPAQDYAYQARDALRKMVKQSKNTISLSFGLDRQDKYQRTLAHLYTTDGTNIQNQLIKQGLATAFTVPPNDRHTDCYTKTESIAIKNKQGIWSLPAYQLKSSNNLTQNDRGFYRIQGEVTGTSQTKKAFWINLQGRLRIRIAQTDVHNFNRYRLDHLKGQAIQVRGWIHPKAKGHFMALRHSSSLNILK